LQRAERVALAVAAPMDVFLTLTGPLTAVMTRDRRFGAAGFWNSRHSPRLGALTRRTEADRRQRTSLRATVFGQEEMLINALELDNITARQVMVPRPSIFRCPPISTWMKPCRG